MIEDSKSRNPVLKIQQLLHTTFISAQEMADVVQFKGTQTIIKELADYIKQDFLRWDHFDKSPRYASHSREGVIELMPTSDGEQFSFKYVNGHPKNTKQGLQTVTAFGVLSDVDSGYPILLSEMTLLTALRTAATSALMATFLAPKNPQCMAMIGCGAQSEFQILAFHTLLGVQQIRLFDVDIQAAMKCQSNLANHGLDIVICQNASAAVAGAHIITTCTADKKNATILSADMVSAGVHINAIGGDCSGKTELAADLLRRAEVFVEYEPQTRIEGDIQQLPDSFEVTEMHEVIKGRKSGRQEPQQITIFDGVGFAIEDFSALRYMYNMVHTLGRAKSIDLFSRPADPRDLFALIAEKSKSTSSEMDCLANAEDL